MNTTNTATAHTAPIATVEMCSSYDEHRLEISTEEGLTLFVGPRVYGRDDAIDGEKRKEFDFSVECLLQAFGLASISQLIGATLEVTFEDDTTCVAKDAWLHLGDTSTDLYNEFEVIEAE